MRRLQNQPVIREDTEEGDEGHQRAKTFGEEMNRRLYAQKVDELSVGIDEKLKEE